jgi:nucleotide-binding universal stress UspA family protein
MRINDFKRILVPTDFSETSYHALEEACRIASKFDAQLFIIHVMEKPPYELVPSEENPEEKIVYQKYIMDKMENLTKSIADRHGIDVNSLIGEAKLVQVVDEAVRDNNIDVIVMGTHGSKGIREFLIGSNSQNITNGAACPVITIKEASEIRGLNNIVMPVESWNSSLEKLDYVSTLAQKYNSKVHILGIMGNNKQQEIDKVNELVASAEKFLNDANIPSDKKMITGHSVGKETLQYAREIKADVIIVMTEHESRLGSGFSRDFVKHIINHSEISVMSIKPAMYHAEKVSIHKEPVHRSEHSNLNE